MKPVFKATMVRDCTATGGIVAQCLYTFSLYPDMTYVVRLCGGECGRGHLGNPKYGVETIFRIMESSLEKVIREHTKEEINHV